MSDSIVLLIMYAIGFSIVIGFIIWDHLRYWKQLDDFEYRARAFARMYDEVSPRMNPDSIKIIEYQSEFYNFEFECSDEKSFWKYVLEKSDEVLEYYNRIDSKYLGLMDDETAERVDETKRLMDKINQIARMCIWERGWRE